MGAIRRQRHTMALRLDEIHDEIEAMCPQCYDWWPATPRYWSIVPEAMLCSACREEDDEGYVAGETPEERWAAMSYAELRSLWLGAPKYDKDRLSPFMRRAYWREFKQRRRAVA